MNDGRPHALEHQRKHATEAVHWALAAAVALSVVLSTTTAAEATHLANGQVSASSTTSGAANVTYTASGRVGGGNPSTQQNQGSVVLTFPAGYDVSGASLLSSEVCNPDCQSGGSNFVISGQQLQLNNLPGVLAVGHDFAVSFAGITNPQVPPVWADQSLASFLAGTAYSDGVDATAPNSFSLPFQLFQNGPGSAISTSGSVSLSLTTTPPTYSVSAGALPTGISLDADSGAVTGTPTVPGQSYNFTISASNDDGAVSATFSGSVDAELVWTKSDLAPIVVGVAYSDGVVAEGSPTPIYSISAGSLPTGLSLDPTTGVISGTATASEDYSFSVTATNSVGAISLDFTASTARPDPTANAEVMGVLRAQAQAAERYQLAQMTNISNRQRGVRAAGHNSSSNALALALQLDDQSIDLAALGGALLPFNTLATPDGIGVWTAGTVEIGRSDSSSSSAKNKFQSAGVTIGVDRQFSEHTLLGFATGFGWGKDEVGSNDSRVDAKQYAVAAYGSWFDTGFFLDALVGYGRLDFDLQRWSQEANAMAKSNRDGHQLFGSLTGGYDFVFDALIVSPFAGIEAGRTWLESYDESGAGMFDLSYSSQRVNMVNLPVGLRSSYTLTSSWGTARPYLQGEYQRGMGDYGKVDINYVNAPLNTDFRASLDNRTRNTWVIGGGADFDIGEKLSITASYRHRFAIGDGQSGQGLIGATYRF